MLINLCITVQLRIIMFVGSSNSCPALSSNYPRLAVFIRWKPRHNWAVVWNDCQKVNANDTDSWSYKLCALHVDEMELKKQLEVDRTTGNLYGFTDIGSGWLCNIVSTGSSDLQGTW